MSSSLKKGQFSGRKIPRRPPRPDLREPLHSLLSSPLRCQIKGGEAGYFALPVEFNSMESYVERLAAVAFDEARAGLLNALGSEDFAKKPQIFGNFELTGTAEDGQVLAVFRPEPQTLDGPLRELWEAIDRNDTAVFVRFLAEKSLTDHRVCIEDGEYKGEGVVGVRVRQRVRGWGVYRFSKGVKLGFSVVKFLENLVTFHREMKVLDEISKDTGGLYPLLLRKYTGDSGGVELIQGPPGTGKTHTILKMAEEIVSAKGGKVLICAVSNGAVDELFARAGSRLGDCVRVGNGGEEVEPLRGRGVEPLRGPYKTRISLDSRDLSSVLRSSTSIFCTLSCCGHPSILKIRDFLSGALLDEAAQASETSSICLTRLHPIKLVAVGDPQQLGPTTFHKYSKELGLTRPMMARLLELGFPCRLLRVQRRMVPILREFPSRFFYAGKLRDAPEVRSKEYTPPNIERFCSKFVGGKALALIQVEGVTALSGAGGFFNLEEALIIGKILKALGELWVNDIGVISPYKEQVGVIRSRLIEEDRGRVMVNTVDGFQGREKGVILVSCVKSQWGNGEICPLGFLTDPRRVNVLLTRAKYLLILVGNGKTLAQEEPWKSLVEFLKEKQSIFEFNDGKCKDRPKRRGVEPLRGPLIPDRSIGFTILDDIRKNSVSLLTNKDKSIEEGEEDPDKTIQIVKIGTSPNVRVSKTATKTAQNYS